LEWWIVSITMRSGLPSCRIIEAKGLDQVDAILRRAIGEQVLPVMRALRKQETVEQIRLGRGVRCGLSGAQ
jgi:hypothetical protein